MIEKLARARSIYRDGGGRTLRRRAGRYVLREVLRLPGFDRICYRVSVTRLRRRMAYEESLDDIVATAFGFQGMGRFRSISPMQVEDEITALLTCLHRRKPETVMEIGTARGGSLYLWCRYLDPTLVISVDHPDGEFGGGFGSHKIEFYRQFGDETNTEFIIGDSHDEETFDEVRRALGDECLDFLFIDGDHTYEGVRQDFELYRGLVRDGGLIAIHDICERPDKPRIQVDEFWAELKADHDTDEIIGQPYTKSDGRDVHLGIGLVYV